MNNGIIICIIIVLIIISCIFIYNNNAQKEGFWPWNSWYNTPCVEDAFGNVMCDPMFNYLYPNYYYPNYYPNPYLYSGPEIMYRRIYPY